MGGPEVSAGSWQARFDLAFQRHLQGDLGGAEALYRTLIQDRPSEAEPLRLIGLIALETGRTAEAAAWIDAAIRLAPDQAASHRARGDCFRSLGDWERAIASYRHALALDPGLPGVHGNLGIALREADDQSGALDSLARGIAEDPTDFGLRLNHCMAHIPLFYDEATEIGRSRAAYEAALEDLSRLVAGLPVPMRRAAAGAVGAAQPFYLPYQGQDDSTLQRRYGALVAALVAGDPAPPLAQPRRHPGGRLRVLIASAFFHRHSVWSAITHGWLERLDPDRFEVIGLDLTGVGTKLGVTAGRACIVAGPRPIAGWLAAIRDATPDVLIYPEIGMDPISLQLAAHRLAPVQCAAWGHPVTTGLPTLDYYLSADLLEPPDGDRHYSETLVRLSGLGCSPDPVALPGAPKARAELGLPGEGVLYFCGQTLFKYLPDYDRLLIAIARAVPDARFVFFHGLGHRALSGRLLRRLHGAFAAAGLDPDRHVVIRDRVDPSGFATFLAAFDVFLDSIGFSGFNTALSALAAGLPVVTHAGPFMRGRLAAGLLWRMGLSELVADDLDGFVARAVELGRDAARRRHLRDAIRPRLDRVYDADAAIRSLESFLLRARAEAG